MVRAGEKKKREPLKEHTKVGDCRQQTKAPNELLQPPPLDTRPVTAVKSSDSVQYERTSAKSSLRTWCVSSQPAPPVAEPRVMRKKTKRKHTAALFWHVDELDRLQGQSPRARRFRRLAFINVIELHLARKNYGKKKHPLEKAKRTKLAFALYSLS